MKILGQDAEPNGIFHLIYAKLKLRPDLYDKNRKPVKFPYKKVSSVSSLSHKFSANIAVSECELRAANYLGSIFGHYDLCRLKLTHDEREDDDISFISFGGLSNNMSVKVMNDNNNNFIKFSQSGQEIIFNKTNEPVITLENGYDYGLILRINPAQFTNKVWIVCAGIGEWGTSGAAWYLANKWEELLRRNRSWYNPLNFGKIKNFAAIIRIRPPYDNSAELINHYNSQEIINHDRGLTSSERDKASTPLYGTDSTAVVTTFTAAPSAKSDDDN